MYTFNLSKTAKAAKLKAKKEKDKGDVKPETLSDKTKIAGTTWGGLKERAMVDEYKE